ncbi:MAG: ATP-binding cassette domain-containing protein, partial [Phaeodactylibacter sp.]|nr:ATP-binding cassette domain-containing protein [Phaeodactylibacter sp.]
RQNLMNAFLIPNRDAAGVLDFKINYVFLSINLISQYGLYFVMAVILFLLPQWGFLDQSAVIAYVVIILFIAGPINNLINLQQMYTRFVVANRRIKNFVRDFQNEESIPTLEAAPAAAFQSLEFQETCYAYTSASGEESFSLGPVSLKIEQGETLFIIGGNGSGKSTFIKTLTGLYEPSGGRVLLNGLPVQHKEEVQSRMAAVFTNNHLFSHNYQGIELKDNPEYNRLLKIMQLEEVVRDDSDEEARRNFSKGQSKRMSLIFALLENKPILVLDEWAADQDPYFRKYFYEELLPRLKAEGKTIIAVTHDDAYFHQADRIIKFDYGKIVKDLRVSTKAALKEIYWA